MTTPRDKVGVILTVCLTLSVITLAQTDNPVMVSSVFDWKTIEAKPTRIGSTRKFFQAPTATLDELECHVTTLNPGETPHPPHKHPDEELIIIKEGTVEVLNNGQIKRVGPGSVIFQAANQMHSIRNIGETPATYHVVKWNSPGMLRLATGVQNPPMAVIDGTGPGWASLGEKDFVNVNGQPDTWTWKDGLLTCTGQPIGVMRTRQTFTNFEMTLQWRHLRSGGNSGVFVWVPDEALKELKPDALPQYGIEVQALDHGFAEQYEKRTGKKSDWFTTNGDIFAVGKSKMQPFPPTSPNGSRSFPRKQLSKGVGEWNHYYIRAINGEVRLWVNGEEVSGGTAAEPRTGYLCLESEGSPIEFRNLRIRELP